MSVGALGPRTARIAKVPGNSPHVSSKGGVNVIHTECLTCSSLNYYGAPSGTKIVHALQRDYLDCVTETRIWQTRIQIALRELAFRKRVSKSRYENSRLELALRELARAFGKRVFRSRYGNSHLRLHNNIVLRETRDWERLDAPYRHETRLQNPCTKHILLGKCVH